MLHDAARLEPAGHQRHIRPQVHQRALVEELAGVGPEAEGVFGAQAVHLAAAVGGVVLPPGDLPTYEDLDAGLVALDELLSAVEDVVHA